MSLPLMYHAALDLCFITVNTGEPFVGVNAVDADEEQIHKDLVHVGNGLKTDERKPIAAQMAADPGKISVTAHSEALRADTIVIDATGHPPRASSPIGPTSIP